MAEPGLPNQKRRTRKDLLQAAARLMRQGRKPTLEEVAEEALVSRATAYRYFPGVEQLLVEASFDVATPDPEALFQGVPDDPAERLQRVDTALHDMTLANEAALRLMLAYSVQREVDGVPSRQNRRSPLIQAALAPARLPPEAADRLAKAAAFLMGPEAMVVAKDVLQLEDADARAVKRWALRALVRAALREGPEDGSATRRKAGRAESSTAASG